MAETATKILAVETSGYQGSVALTGGRDGVDERSLAAEGMRNAQTLVMEVQQLLQDHSVDASDIDGVAVSIGPGSFTGLRVGVVFAKTFCWANGCPLIAVDTFQAVACQTRSAECRVTVISDAQRNELFVNEYLWNDDTNIPSPAGEVRIESMDSLQQTLTAESSLLTGPGLEKHGPTLSAAYPLADKQRWFPRATAVAQIGCDRFASRCFADLHTLEPLCIRRSYAEEKNSAGDKQ